MGQQGEPTHTPDGVGGGGGWLGHEPTDLTPAELARRQRQALVRVLRLAFIVILATVTLLTIYRGVDSGVSDVLTTRWPWTLAVAAVAGLLAILVDIFTPQKKISTLFSILFGLLGAMLVTAAIGVVVDVLARSYEFERTEVVAAIKLLIGICLAYLGISTVLQTQDDFRLVIPYVEFAKQIRGTRPLVLDSSALIDARIVDLAQTGLVQSQLVIPGFVVRELQTLADSGDRLKRQRGRRGLDMVAKLQRMAGVDVALDERSVSGTGADQQLIALAKQLPGVIVTTDAGLVRVAGIQSAEVLNVHDVAGAMRSPVTPGEAMRLRLVRVGEQPDQGVGYLEDGTMVVAERCADRVGETVELVVVSTIQTSAGRMVFARTPEDEAADRLRRVTGERDGPDDAPNTTPGSAPDADGTDRERAEGFGGGGGMGEGTDRSSASPPPRRPRPTGRNPRR
ncbi:MAG: PIN/TRAM domain-containing protein [Phycisphaerales bacterium]|nr:MAG: PIN/TRAM domain-containing protein [Phycisphaerales bacterium]